MNDEVQKVETGAETEIQKVEAETVTLWHEVEGFFTKLIGNLSNEAIGRAKVLQNMKQATHEIVGTTPPVNTAVAAANAAAATSGTPETASPTPLAANDSSASGNGAA